MQLTTYRVTFSRLFFHLQPYRLKLFFALCLTTASALLSLVPLICVFFIARSLLATGTMAARQVWFLAAAAAVSVVLRFAGYLFAMGLSHYCAFGVHYDLRARIASHLAILPMGFFGNRSSGELKKVMGEDVENIELFIGHYLPDLVSAVALPVVSAILLFRVNPVLALAALAPVPLAAFAHHRMNKIYRKNVGNFHDNVEAMNTAIVEYVRGMPVIKAFNKTVDSFAQYKKALGTHLSISEDWARSATALSAFFWTCLDLGLLFIVPAGFWLYGAGTITGAEFVLFLLMGPGLMEPLGRIIMITGYLDRIGEGIGRIQSILDQAPLQEPGSPKAPKGYAVEFDNVSFGYGKEDVLKGASFSLPEGTVTGLVGLSGAGKSTAARLAARFWDVRRGSIRMGGVDIRDIPMDELMTQIAFVFQEVYLMNDTIMENIRMGNPAATDKAVMAA
ncbi:MAG: ABC transporter ATP-binding protein/permease, partial [Desulfobacterales bacterium]|nr:ABC transporter ATP-binding protein/permease [Desulfobacterales bacterium]